MFASPPSTVEGDQTMTLKYKNTHQTDSNINAVKQVSYLAFLKYLLPPEKLTIITVNYIKQLFNLLCELQNQSEEVKPSIQAQH